MTNVIEQSVKTLLLNLGQGLMKVSPAVYLHDFSQRAILPSPLPYAGFRSDGMPAML